MHNAFLLLRSPTETISSLWTWHQLETHNVLRQLLTGQTLAPGRADSWSLLPKVILTFSSLVRASALLYRSFPSSTVSFAARSQRQSSRYAQRQYREHIRTDKKNIRWCSQEGKAKRKVQNKTYSSRDSHVVTHRSTNLPFNCLCMAERTGCPVFS